MISSWYVTFNALHVLNTCVYVDSLINSVCSPFLNTISKKYGTFPSSCVFSLFTNCTTQLGSFIKVVHISPFYVYCTMVKVKVYCIKVNIFCWQLLCSFIFGLFQTDSTDQNGDRPATEAASKKHFQHLTQSSLLTGFRTEMKLCMRISRTENKRSSSIADVM